MAKKKPMTKKELKEYKQKWVKKRAKVEKTVGVVRRTVRAGPKGVKYKKGTTIKSKATRAKKPMTKTQIAAYKADWVKKDRAKKKRMGLVLRQVKGKWKWIKK